MRAGPAFLAITFIASLLGPVISASAACRCVCYRGRSEPRCTATDPTPPICANLCLESAGEAPLRAFVDRPLAGGVQALEPVTPSDPNWQSGPERGSFVYGSDPATGAATTGAAPTNVGR